jgi:hypothetical protein
VPVASTSAVQQGFQNFFKKRCATPTPMGTRVPVRGAYVSAIAIGARGAEGTRKKLRAAALAFPTAAAPLISPRLCGPPTGLTNWEPGLLQNEGAPSRRESQRPFCWEPGRPQNEAGHRTRPLQCNSNIKASNSNTKTQKPIAHKIKVKTCQNLPTQTWFFSAASRRAIVLNVLLCFYRSSPRWF